MISETKQQHIEWRRSKVLELGSRGYSQREIARKLGMNLADVNRDIQFLRKQAQQSLQKHINEVIPDEYQKCMIGMKQNLKQVLEIGEAAADPKIKLESRRIANDCYRYIMDLSTNVNIVSDALKFVTQKQEQMNTLQKSDGRIEEAIEGEERKTTNGTF